MKNSILIILSLSLLLPSCEDNRDGRTISESTNLAIVPFPYEQIDIKPSLFTIDNSRDTLLFGKAGLIIYVPAKVFLTKKIAPVELFLKEYSSVAATMGQSISNTSIDNKLLTASTIIHIEAKQGQHNLSLSPEKDIRVLFKRIKTAPAITLWRGEPQAWIPLNFDKPKLFHHILRMGEYKNLLFSDGSSPDHWEKSNLSLNPQEEKQLWRLQKNITLYYKINKQGKAIDIRFKEPLLPILETTLMARMEAYPLCKPYIKNGAPKTVACEYAFHVHQAEPKYRKDVPFLDILRKDYPTLKKEKIGHVDNLELKYHIFNIANLGWIAAAQGEEKVNAVNLTIEVEPTFLAEVKVLLSKSKLIFTGKRNGNKIEFPGLPQDESIKIIAFGQKEKQPYLATLNANSSDGTINNLEFSVSSFDAIKLALEKTD
jgi:hypothetical protein